MTKILVAEDERDIRELIGFTLQFAGFDVVLVANGAEAVERASLEKPDLIILDVRMPKVTGPEACRLLKEDPATSAIPVVFLSAEGQSGGIEHGLDSGAVGYIVKPFSPDELTDRIKEILQRVGSSDSRGGSPSPRTTV